MLFVIFLSRAVSLSIFNEAWCTITSQTVNVSTTPLPNAFGYATFNDSMNDTGWYQLHVTGFSNASSPDVLRCGGALEGFLTAHAIDRYFAVVWEMQDWEQPLIYPPKLAAYLAANLKHIRESVVAYQESAYWQSIGLIIAQFDGLVEGYHLAGGKLNESDIWFLQCSSDVEDISSIVGYDPQPGSNKARRRWIERGSHCSGLVQILPDFSDLFFAHDTWSDYRDLRGQLKEYHFPVPEFKAQTIVLSTRVGLLSSTDDFYAADTGLFVLETTMNNFNDKLYKYCDPAQLFTWLRAVHATWTTDSGQEWTETFIRYNSGTYNNEYLIVDSKRLKRFEKPTADLLWIIEQYPGVYRSADITRELVNQGYFPSFNTPWFEDLYSLAGFPEIVADWGDDGDYWTYTTSARFYTFARECPRVKTFEHFKALMRYNNWRRDIYSNGDPGQQIMARYDQREHRSPRLPARKFGGLDSKCLRLTEARNKLRFVAFASPTYDIDNGIPMFTFSGAGLDHRELPDVWNFSWLQFDAECPDRCAKFGKKDCVRDGFCGWCTRSAVCLAGGREGPFLGQECQAGWTVSTVPLWVVPIAVGLAIVAVVVLIVVVVVVVRKKKYGII
jgi:hypothetical protein